MAQINQIEAQVKIECNADKTFDIWARKTLEISKLCPEKIFKIELLKGDKCHALGSVLEWTYVTPVDGKYETGKTILEEIDEENRSFTWKVIEGSIMSNYYKTFTQKIEITPKRDNGCIVKFRLVEFEKKFEDAPHPRVFVDFFLERVQDVDRHLCSN